MDIKELLKYTVESGASDLHLGVESIPAIRLNGQIKNLNMPKVNNVMMTKMVNDILNKHQKEKLNEIFEIDFSYHLDDLARFRVNMFKQINGISAAFRTISEKIKSVDELGLPAILNDLAIKDKGLILLTGPTGSGKSTTLAAMVDHINDNKNKHIITIEDPIEYYHQQNRCIVNQRELGQSTLSFSNALRSALREDPDVILVGEMRDLETIQLALTAAETGHLVLSTLHTSSSVKTIDRIIDVFPSGQKEQIRSMLSESLVAVIAQKLIINKKQDSRVPACEIMVANTAVKNLIRENKIYQIPTIIQSGGKEGMQSLDMDLQRLLKTGIINRNQAAEVANTPELFENAIL